MPGTGYTLSFDLAGNFGAGPVVKPLAVTINGVTSNFLFDTTGRSASAMGWTTHSISFVATGTSSTVNFESDVSAAGGTLNAGAALDNVRLVAASVAAAPSQVPLGWAQWAALAAIGLAALVVFRRRSA